MGTWTNRVIITYRHQKQLFVVGSVIWSHANLRGPPHSVTPHQEIPLQNPLIMPGNISWQGATWHWGAEPGLGPLNSHDIRKLKNIDFMIMLFSARILGGFGCWAPWLQLLVSGSCKKWTASGPASLRHCCSMSAWSFPSMALMSGLQSWSVSPVFLARGKFSRFGNRQRKPNGWRLDLPPTMETHVKPPHL